MRRHWHRWGKWIDGTATHESIFIKGPWDTAIQARRCEICGKVQIRELR